MSWYNKKSESGNVTLLKRSEFSDVHINHHPQEYGLYTQCKYKGHSCDLFNIHLDDSSSQIRHKQWHNLQTLCRGDCRAIVAGDFNHQYKSNSKLYNTSGFMTMADLEKFFTPTQTDFFKKNTVLQNFANRFGYGYDPSPYEQMMINQGRTPYTQTSGGK